MFLQGMTPYGIASKLTAEGIPSPGKKPKWNAGTVKRMLANEKYKGDALLQKSFTTDFLTKKKKLNEGEIPQYYVTGNHEAIIEPEVFDMVQRELVRRGKGRNRHSGVHAFSGKIKCGTCGSWFGSKVWHIDTSGKVQAGLRRDLEAGTLQLPEEAASYRTEIETVCRRAYGRLPIQDARKRETVGLNKEIYLSEEFKELWDRIKWKTRYRVNFSSDELLAKCRAEMAADFKVAAAKIIQTKVEMAIEESGVQTKKIHPVRVRDVQAYHGALPDVVAYLQNETNLTRRTIVELLTGRRRMADGTWEAFDEYGNHLDAFRRNPQLFMEKTAKIVRKVMKSLIVAGIRYERLGDTEFYQQELFASEELQGYLESNMLKSKRSPYNYIIYDSKNERNFAKHFEDDPAVKCFAKLPAWFKISTPLGSYNPDWAILFDIDGERKLYFVVETKGNVDDAYLRPVEREKIHCGRAHFRALGGEAVFEAIDDYETFRMNV